jgi:hypothetical protein
MSKMRSWLIERHNKAVIDAQRSLITLRNANSNNRDSRLREHQKDTREVWVIRGLLDLIETLMPYGIEEEDQRERKRK